MIGVNNQTTLILLPLVKVGKLALGHIQPTTHSCKYSVIRIQLCSFVYNTIYGCWGCSGREWSINETKTI